MGLALTLAAGWPGITAQAGGDRVSATNVPAVLETATFGAGCFWCIEALFLRLPGVVSVRPGFMGGNLRNPTYNQVCKGDTGHAEVAEIRFDPSRVSYATLRDWFWKSHDPTQKNRQGADIGSQYRSVIFTHGDVQRRAAEASKASYAASGARSAPIATVIEPAQEFFPAEDYHRDYFARNRNAPYCRLVIEPKLRKLGVLDAKVVNSKQ